MSVEEAMAELQKRFRTEIDRLEATCTPTNYGKAAGLKIADAMVTDLTDEIKAKGGIL